MRYWPYFLIALLLSPGARAQSTFADPKLVRSVSGQFIVSSTGEPAPYFRNLATPDATNFVRLEPALLAVAAEGFKQSLWRDLGLPASPPSATKFSLVLHPARSLEEVVVIGSEPFLNRWNYRVEFPDYLSRARYARAMSAVLLLEIANRATPPGRQAAEIPSWLVDGCAQEVMATDGEKVTLSAPTRQAGERTAGRLDQVVHGFDPLVNARRILLNLPVLTFDQLSWPTAAQQAGLDGGAYAASAQLFVHELLALKNGPARIRSLLAELPDHLNWQTAFYDAFRDDFKRPLEVEKWWALRVIGFAARDPGPRWTVAISRDRLAAMLSVPVDYRTAANALPEHAEISLQAALQNLDPAQRDTVLRTKLRDLSLDALRLAPPFAELAAGYHTVLADYLGDRKNAGPGSTPNPPDPTMAPKPGIGSAMVFPDNSGGSATSKSGAGIRDTLKKLDALDQRRRAAEARSRSLMPNSQ